MEPSAALITFTKDAARTGAAISGSIFELLSASQHSPKEVYEVAKAVADLSVALEDLGGEWRGIGGPEAKMKRELERQATSALECIATLHGDIRALIDPGNAAARLLWAFRRTRWCALLWQADYYKAGIRLIMTTVALAFRLSCAAEYVLLLLLHSL
ncbi:hypothetical protein PG996_004854 [Apiospora saccharicola]|uniref:Fungal N-terminal domain-containing protein n=1 Tax=Apiospora saccharicola TaxID=335842 RepID=A0ABR1W5C2_9PEZI